MEAEQASAILSQSVVTLADVMLMAIIINPWHLSQRESKESTLAIKMQKVVMVMITP
jgi:hypothetical protein